VSLTPVSKSLAVSLTPVINMLYLCQFL
jgi:hypothetical protein